jgi:penicillin amidase
MTTETLRVPGLEAQAEIIVDRWGIPHIRATTRRDIFFVQGFNAARDRGWQLDIWYKRGLGRMAADFGPGFLAQDRAARLFLFRGDMAAEWAAYGTDETRSIVEAFVAGVNAFNALGNHAPEFAAMGTRPASWVAEEMMSIRSHALVRNAISEVARAHVMHHADAQTDLARRSIEPEWTPIVPEGLDLADITADVLDNFRLATVGPKFPPERLACTLADAWKWTKVTELGDVTLQGSNNWVVAPSRTDTGRPILASDPHRAHALPSLRYIVHLDGPGLNAIGTGEPAVPGISFGHNGTAAFSLTIFPMDQEDLYVYETHPDDPTRYRYNGGWEQMSEITETIAVKGEADQTVSLRFTRHGPVVAEHLAKNRAFAIRSVWAEPGTFAYFASLACMQATTPAAYEAAVSHWRAPSINHLYADTAGNIAWWARGLVPVRTTWDGLLPAPGDGRHEWQGFHRPDELPSAINPPAGWFATANEMNLPPGFPIDERRIGFEWSEHSRTDRIHQVLGAQDQHSIAQSMKLQTDSISLPGLRMRAVVAQLKGEGDLAGALEL